MFMNTAVKWLYIVVHKNIKFQMSELVAPSYVASLVQNEESNGTKLFCCASLNILIPI